MKVPKLPFLTRRPTPAPSLPEISNQGPPIEPKLDGQSTALRTPERLIYTDTLDELMKGIIPVDSSSWKDVDTVEEISLDPGPSHSALQVPSR